MRGRGLGGGIVLGVLCVLFAGGLVAGGEVVEIGGRLEPLVDDFLFERIEGEVKWELHRPVRHAEPLMLDRPWEGNNSNYGTILKHEGRFFFYYRGTALELGEKRIGGTHFATTCVMTSADGIHWERPDLGFVKKPGWEKNNIILTFDPECKINFSKGESLDDGNDLLSGKKVPFTGAVHNFTPMIDTNPDCPPEQKFKAVGGHDHRLLYAFVSPDGLNWSMLRTEPIITDGMLDSQNLAFWDPVQKCYYAYYRDFKNKEGDTERRDSRKDYSLMDRDVKYATSKDFVNWTKGDFIDWQPERGTQLYTSQIQLYPGAEHLRIGFPMRYVIERGLYSAFNERLAKSDRYYASLYTDTGFVSSRDGRTFRMWDEALVRPGPTEEQWQYSFGGTALNLIETPSEYPGGPMEWSMYLMDHGAWFGPGVSFNRYSIRKDGFVSASASKRGGTLVTKPIVFAGDELQINFETSVNGSIRVEVQGEHGAALPGFSLGECREIFGNSVGHRVTWSSAELREHAGKPVRLKIELKDADLFSLRFINGE